jgi:hypothetical protein
MTEKHEEDKGFGWDDPIDPTIEGKRNPLLPDGKAKFVVIKIERKREEYGTFGTQNVAHVHMSVASLVDLDMEPAEMEEKLCLHQDLQWKITQFFTAIGQRKHGNQGKFVPNWKLAEDEGSGECMMKSRKYIPKRGKNQGKELTVNNIDRYLDPAEESADGGLNL